MGKTVTQKFTEFISEFSLDAIPQSITDKAKTCIINIICMGVSSHDAEEGKVAREIVKSEEKGIAGGQGSTLFCDGSYVSTMGAAFANSVLFTERAQEDTLGTTHVGTVITPAILAVGEKINSSGKEILEAVIVGYEIAGALDKTLASFTTPRGLRATPIFGIIACAGAIGKLMNLSRSEIANALGFAVGFAGGNLESLGVGTKEVRFQGGVAAREGILSALIAKSGVVASPTAFEGTAGFLKTMTNTNENWERIGNDLGKLWEINNATFKPYPVCVGAQAETMITVELINDNGIDFREIEKIEVIKDPYFVNYPGVDYKGPFHSIEATLMSSQFTQALACVDKDVTFLGLHRYDDPAILDLVGKVRLISEKSISFPSGHIRITMKNGTNYEKKMLIEEEYFNFDMDKVIRLGEKVTTETSVSQKKVESAISFIQELDKQQDIKQLIKVLAGCP